MAVVYGLFLFTADRQRETPMAPRVASELESRNRNSKTQARPFYTRGSLLHGQ